MLKEIVWLFDGMDVHVYTGSERFSGTLHRCSDDSVVWIDRDDSEVICGTLVDVQSITGIRPQNKEDEGKVK